MHGYTFGGWYNSSRLLTLWDFNTPIVENITIYAKWYTNPYVSLISDGAVFSQKMIVYNTAIEESSITRVGYTFGGLYLDYAFSNKWNMDKTITENVILYVKWYKNPIITFESNGGSDIFSQTISYDSVVTEPNDPTKTGYTFFGWYSNSALTQSYNFSTKVTKDITLYAKWSKNSYKVTFESNGGTCVDPQYTKYNTTATLVTPERTGYTFGGWYSNAALTESYSFSTKITGNIILYAKWTINKYKVNFNSNNGSDITSQTIEYNSLVNKPSDPVRSGYVFGGWYSNYTLTSKYNFSTSVTENLTLYAKWISTSGTLPDMGVEDLF